MEINLLIGSLLIVAAANATAQIQTNSAPPLPWAKPLVAGLTTVMIAASYWWMRTRSRKEKSDNPCCTLSDDESRGSEIAGGIV